jgi:hypothetical protein
VRINGDDALSGRARPGNHGGRPALALFSQVGLGRLPGDIVIERENMTFYFPLMTCLLVSVLFSLVFWVVNR